MASHHPASAFSSRLSRRRALTHVAPGLAALGIASSRPSPLLAQEASPPPDEPPTEEVTGGVTPARAALAVERLPAIAESMLQQSGVPGMAVAIVFADTLLEARGFGLREIGGGANIDADTVFQLASVSKPLAATVVSAVVGDGVVTWDSRMADLAPDFALHEAWPTQNVSLADLFAHRSGLPDHGGDVLEDLGFDRAEILHRLRFLEPEYSFREGYAYTNFGLTAAAVAVAETAGMSWQDLSAERLYTPLGMTHTSSRFADYMAESNRAIPHVQDGTDWVVTPMQREPDAQSPAGGASASARDLAQWVRLQLGQGSFDGQQLIPAAALAPMHLPQAVSNLPEDPATQRAGFYGLGINVSYTDFGTVQWSHSGAFALGAATAVFMLPGSGFGVLALTNGAPIGVPEAVCLSVLDLATTGDLSRDWLQAAGSRFAAMAASESYGSGTDWNTPPPDAAPAAPHAAYLETYRNAFYGAVEIAAAGDNLVMRIGPQPREFPLNHYDRDTFSWQPTGENAAGRSGLSFLIGPDGAAISFRDQYLDKNGPGTLSRVDGVGE
ncbi:MAG: serine hydrolase [Chloroflexota bacterium]|nr:serine hydrolase [Chloroflexota bacterium]